MATTRSRGFGRKNTSPLPPAVEATGEVKDAIRRWWTAYQSQQIKAEAADRLATVGYPVNPGWLKDALQWESDCWWQLQQIVPPAWVAYRCGDVTFGYTRADRSGLSPRAFFNGEVVRK